MSIVEQKEAILKDSPISRSATHGSVQRDSTFIGKVSTRPFGLFVTEPNLIIATIARVKLAARTPTPGVYWSIR